jgi:multisubunit Na+/H+ antiporter MnhC subunit
MNAIQLIAALCWALAITVAIAGLAYALAADNLVKRLVGLASAMLACIAALALRGAPQGLLIAAAVAGFAQVALGTALLVRIQEDYGEIESRDLDNADRSTEPNQ